MPSRGRSSRKLARTEAEKLASLDQQIIRFDHVSSENDESQRMFSSLARARFPCLETQSWVSFSGCLLKVLMQGDRTTCKRPSHRSSKASGWDVS